MTSSLTWVVGRGGLLGGAVGARLVAGSAAEWAPSSSVPWATPDASPVLDVHRRAFLSDVAGHPWTVIWCAGAGVTASHANILDEEVSTFERFLAGIDLDDASRGTIALASSAGGIYAGSLGAPFDEHSATRPLAPYGHAKLAMEDALRAWVARTGGRALVGRIGNLYGPGQDIRKPQGLISQLLRAHVQRRPLQVYVPLDTIRDYIYVADAATRLLASARRAATGPGTTATTKIIATQHGYTIGAVLGELRRVLQRRPQIIVGSSPVARLQARDLRLRSRVWPDLDRPPLTPLPVGINATFEAMARQLQRGEMPAAV